MLSAGPVTPLASAVRPDGVPETYPAHLDAIDGFGLDR